MDISDVTDIGLIGPLHGKLPIQMIRRYRLIMLGVRGGSEFALGFTSQTGFVH
jgi:hypothetical protein